MSGHTKNSKEISRYYRVTDEQRTEAAKKLVSKGKVESLMAQLATLTPDELAKVKSIFG